MWTEAELADWEATYARCLDACARAELDADLASVFALVSGGDDERERARIASELERSFLQYADPQFVNPQARTAEGVRPLQGVLFYYAGAEVEPYVPVQAWGVGIADAEVTSRAGTLRRVKKKAVNFSDCGGYDLGKAATRLYEVAEEDLALDDRRGYDDVYKAVILDSFRLAKLALRHAVETDAFRQLPQRAPFHFWATPGHDEPTVELWVLSR